MMRILILLLISSSVHGQIINASPYYKPITASAPSFSPKDVTGCLMWVYSDTLGLADNDPVSTWTDLSGNGNSATQSSTARPTYKTAVQNGRAVLRFDGSDDFMSVANTSIIGGNTGMTVFIVVKQASLAINKAILCKWDYATDGTFAVQTSDINSTETIMYVANGCTSAGSENQNSNGAGLGTNFYILEYVYDGTQGTNVDRVKIYVNGIETGYITTGTLNTSLTSCSATLKIGAFGGALTRNYNGDMGEIVLYNSALGSTDRTNVRNYLKAHWGL